MASKDINDLTETIGVCGRFQLILTLAVHAATVTCSMGMMMMVFGMYNPGLICPDGFNSSLLLSLNGTVNVSSSFSAQQAHGDYSLNDDVWTVNCTDATSCERWPFELDTSTLVTEWKLVCDLAWVPSVIISIEMAGVLVGSYISGQVSDRFGRKRALYSFVTLHGVSHLLTSFSVSWQMSATMYLFIGIGVGGIFICTFPYPLEFINGWWRGVFAAIPIWPIGFSVFAVIVYSLRDWRHVHIATAALSLIVLLFGIWTPESVRWLAVSGKVSQSKKVVARIAHINRRPCPDTSAIDELAREEKQKMRGHKYTYLDLFKFSSLRQLTIKLSLIWIFNSYAYYILNFSVSALSGDFYTNLVISAGLEFPANLILLPLLNKLGRRTASLLLIVFEVVCSFSLVLVTFVALAEYKGKVILFLALFAKILNMSTCGVSLVYSPELFPTVVRSLSFGFLMGISRLGAILSPYLIPNDHNNLYACFIVIGILSLIRFGLTLYLPETKREILKDTAFNNVITKKTMVASEEEPV